MTKVSVTQTVLVPTKAVDFLAEHSGLPKLRIKDAMAKGAVLLRRKSKAQRLRRVTAELLKGDQLEFHYDEAILARTPEAPSMVADFKQYSVWFKPSGVLAQGNEFGDHCALLRLVEVALNRPVFLVHRLDREAQGLTLIAHTGKAAAQLSALFQTQAMEKWYRIEALGKVPELGAWKNKIDGKAAVSHFHRLSFDAQKNVSVVDVRIEHGRKHQIRRHFSAAGYPILGDPRYGEGNADARGMQLMAYRLAFTCPMTKAMRDIRAPGF